VTLSAFSFEVKVSGTQITLTEATTATTVDSYIFAGKSLYGPNITMATSNSGHTLDAFDLYTIPNSGASIAAGASVGLGHVFFTVNGTLTAPATVSFTSYPNTSLALGSINVPITSFVDGTISPPPIVPEPSTLALATISLAIFGAAGLIRKKLSHR
jgi:hypothetical protein